MKKFLIGLAVAVIASTGIFAASFSGTWYDSKFDCHWVFLPKSDSNAFLELRNAQTKEVIFTFTTDNVQNYKESSAATGDVVVTFTCQEKNRSYSFTKNFSGSTDLTVTIDNSRYHETYKTKFKMTSSKTE